MVDPHHKIKQKYDYLVQVDGLQVIFHKLPQHHPPEDFGIKGTRSRLSKSKTISRLKPHGQGIIADLKVRSKTIKNFEATTRIGLGEIYSRGKQTGNIRSAYRDLNYNTFVRCPCIQLSFYSENHGINAFLVVLT